MPFSWLTIVSSLMEWISLNPYYIYLPIYLTAYSKEKYHKIGGRLIPEVFKIYIFFTANTATLYKLKTYVNSSSLSCLDLHKWILIKGCLSHYINNLVLYSVWWIKLLVHSILPSAKPLRLIRNIYYDMLWWYIKRETFSNDQMGDTLVYTTSNLYKPNIDPSQTCIGPSWTYIYISQTCVDLSRALARYYQSDGA